MNPLFLYKRWGVDAVPTAGGGGGGITDPTDISDLTLWLDADDATTITESGGSVSQWDDKSGQGNHVTQGTAGNQPDTGSRTINARNVLDFNGDYLSASVNLMGGSITAFAVWESDDADGIAGVISNEGSGRTVIYADTRSGTKRHSVRANGGATYVNLASELSSGASYISTLEVDSNNLAGWIDGAQVDTASGAATARSHNTLYVGRQNLGPLQLNGAIAELIVYDRVLTDTERGDVESYLADRWGVTLA